MPNTLAYLVGQVKWLGTLVWPTDLCHHPAVTLEEAARAYRRAEKTYTERRADLAAAIVEAARAGRKQAEIVQITGYTRERIRQIVADAKEEDPS